MGRRNYRYFYAFIVSLAFLCVFIFACAVTHLIMRKCYRFREYNIYRKTNARYMRIYYSLIVVTKDDKPFLEALRASPSSVIVGVICFFSVWSILGLAGFHTYLTTSNQTTNEDVSMSDEITHKWHRRCHLKVIMFSQIKGSFSSKRGQESFNPYSQGNICGNCFYVLCGPSPPSLIGKILHGCLMSMCANHKIEI